MLEGIQSFNKVDGNGLCIFFKHAVVHEDVTGSELADGFLGIGDFTDCSGDVH